MSVGALTGDEDDLSDRVALLNLAQRVGRRRQAIAIALEEAGDSKYESEARNGRNLHRTERKEAEGKTAQQEREGNSHVGAPGKRESSRSMGGKDARKPTARGEKAARGRAHTADGHTRDERYARAQRHHVEGRSKMTKRQHTPGPVRSRRRRSGSAR
jgi:hypothetical protein